MQLRLIPGMVKRLNKRFERYTLLVGILEDAPHKDARRGKDVLSSYAGGPIRKSSSNSTQSISDVSASIRAHLGFNYLTEPFKYRSPAVSAFSDAFLKFVFGKTAQRRVENALQAIVRNPILRGDYGSNAALTQKIKGFDRKLIDTAQFFKAIKAVCKVRNV